MIPKKADSSLKDLVHELVVGNFAKLEADGRVERLTADDLRQVLADHASTFIDLPDEAFEVGGGAVPLANEEEGMGN